MARMPASWTCNGAGKSGCPMQNEMMSLPVRARLLTSASTTKAFSVPRSWARLDSFSMGLRRKKDLFYRYHPAMLINCVAYQDGKKLAEIAVEDISVYVSRPDCFVWVALKDAEPAELEEMKEEFDLHELAVEDARHGHQRPKIEEYGDSLFAVLHTVEVDGDDLVVGEMDVFVGLNYV